MPQEPAVKDITNSMSARKTQCGSCHCVVGYFEQEQNYAQEIRSVWWATVLLSAT